MKLNFNHKLIISLAAAISCAGFFIIANADEQPSTKAGEMVIENPTQTKGFHIAAVSEHNNKEFVSDVINTDFPFNAVSFSWDAPSDVKFDVFARFQKEDWTTWQAAEIGDATESDPTHRPATELIFTPYTNILQYKLVFADPSQSASVTNLKISYIDSTKGNKAVFSAASDSDGLKIISRAQWGADDRYRFDATGAEKWPQEYYTPKRFIIHHTDSSDVSNPMATVRAIYYFHAQSRDWGDIGYNYLIDPQGNIYEGRAGGDGVVGAHAEGNNRNSIGIAVIGCYHPTSSVCTTPGQLTPETIAALDKLIAYKSQVFDIDPSGRTPLADGKLAPTVLGHRDVGHTNCPGDNIYLRFSEIIDSAKVKLASLPPLQKYATSAVLVSPASQSVEVPDNGTTQLKIQFKNSGQAVWRGYEDNYIFVSTDVKKLGLIDGYKFATASEDADPVEKNLPITINGKLLGGNVNPGETGTFLLELKPENATKTYTLAWNNKGYFAKTDFSVTTVKVKGAAIAGSQPAPVFVPVYKATLISANIPETIAAGSNSAAQITFLNGGNVAWEQNDLTLSMGTEVGTQSPLLNAIDFHPAESEIQPGGVATFNLNFTAGSAQVVTWHIVKLKVAGQELINFNQKITVAGPFAAEIVSEDIPALLKRSTKANVTFTIKNIGSKEWKVPTLKSTSDKGTISNLVDASWENLKVIKSLKKTVKPGEQVTLTFKIKASSKAGQYGQLYKLWDGKQAIVLSGQELMKTSVTITK